MPTRVAVIGATGRLGSQVAQVVSAMPDMTLVASLDSRSDLQEMLGADIAVDVTLPSVSKTVVEFALSQGIKVLVGTSGWSADRLKELEKALEKSPGSAAFVVPNFSLGSTLQTMVAKTIAEHFESIEIVETHHASKVDSPSGTAVRTAEEIAEVRRRQPLVGGVQPLCQPLDHDQGGPGIAPDEVGLGGSIDHALLRVAPVRQEDIAQHPVGVGVEPRQQRRPVARGEVRQQQSRGADPSGRGGPVLGVLLKVIRDCGAVPPAPELLEARDAIEPGVREQLAVDLGHQVGGWL